MSYPQVVRVFATTQEPDYDCPWQARPASSGTGSGVIIGNSEILTGAHVVADATFLQVQKLSEPDKVIARVKAVSHDCDLALLSVDDEHFADGIEAAQIGELPELRDQVSVVGFPVGGEEISITEGVVSRIEVQRYNHSQRHLLAVTVDAAINEGNSGGPVFRDGKVAGIAFQKLSGADNIGEMVPAPLIQRFLAGIGTDCHRHVPGLAIATQNLENPILRKHIGLRQSDSGVLVTGLEYGGSCWGILEAGDALLEISGMRIANNGTVRYRDRYRTRYDVVMGTHYVGDDIELTILRDGQRLRVTVTLKPMERLVSRNQYDTPPTYCVCGGLVFQTLSRNLLTTWDKWWNKAPKEYLHHYYSGVRTEQRREVIVLTQILADEINVGYEHLYDEGIIALNGELPRDMAHFVRRIDEATGLIHIETESKGRITLDSRACRAANQRILERYHITRERSADLAAP